LEDDVIKLPHDNSTIPESGEESKIKGQEKNNKGGGEKKRELGGGPEPRLKKSLPEKLSADYRLDSLK